jgi:hypothetical protein
MVQMNVFPTSIKILVFKLVYVVFKLVYVMFNYLKNI